MYVLEKFSIGQRHGGLRHDQGGLVITSLQVQGNTKPVYYRAKISFQTSANNGTAETGLGIPRREVLLEEYTDERRGEVNHLTEA